MLYIKFHEIFVEIINEILSEIYTRRRFRENLHLYI